MNDVIDLENRRLAAENEQLRADLDGARQHAQDWKAARNRAAEEVERLRSWRTPPSPSAKPDTLEKCHALLEYLDVEISGTVQDYVQTKAKLRRYEEREWLVKRLITWLDRTEDGMASDELAERYRAVRDFDLSPKAEP